MASKYYLPPKEGQGGSAKYDEDRGFYDEPSQSEESKAEDLQHKRLRESGYYLPGEAIEAPGAVQVRHRMMEHSDREIAPALRYLQEAQGRDTAAQRELQSGLTQGKAHMVSQATTRGMSPSALRAARYSGDAMTTRGAAQANMLQAAEEQAAQQQYIQALQRRSDYEQFVQDIANDKAMMGHEKAAADAARRQAAQQAEDDAIAEGVGMVLGAAGSMMSDERLKVGMVEATDRDLNELRDRLRARDDDMMRRNLQARYTDHNSRVDDDAVDRDLDQYRTARELRGLDVELAEQNELYHRGVTDKAPPNLDYTESVDFGRGRYPSGGTTPGWLASEADKRNQGYARGPSAPPTGAQRAEPEVERLRRALREDDAAMQERLFGEAAATEKVRELGRSMAPRGQYAIYEYGPEAQGFGAPSGIQSGPTTQQLGTSELGANMVREGPIGQGIEPYSALRGTMGVAGQNRLELDELRASLMGSPPPWELAGSNDMPHEEQRLRDALSAEQGPAWADYDYSGYVQP